ncbi:MAG: AmmeMemoRadiSam system radical SAM enzyme [Elusimicrobiota bacterium]|nr:AmmeMemoRadiSam system radical SAM enzyme [Elusimicrobiota bacterium]
MQEAKYYTIIDEEKKLVQCELCPHRCKLLPEKTGICRVRKNIAGKLCSLIYNHFTSINLDPIEKKPLYHFYPGSEILSVGTLGCNFRCLHCQNWEISQSDFDERYTREFSSEDALKVSKKYNSIGISYTYNEPLINYEWTLETAKLFQSEGLKNVLVTNGYINEEPWENLLPYIDAANIDVKAYRNEFYKEVCKAELNPVLRSVEIMAKRNKHVEVTYLIIPGYNDSELEIEEFVKWICGVNPEIPVHFSRYFPNYKMDKPATPLKTMDMAIKIAYKHVKYAYLGNVWEREYNRTYCPECNAVLIERIGYNTEIKQLSDKGYCKKCNSRINIMLPNT